MLESGFEILGRNVFSNTLLWQSQGPMLFSSLFHGWLCTIYDIKVPSKKNDHSLTTPLPNIEPSVLTLHLRK
jgi:hypothetical protein